MYKSQFFFCLLLVSLVVIAQEPEDKVPLNPSSPYNWEHGSFSYADLGTGKEHSYFHITYQLNPKLFAELQVFYDSYTFSNRLRAELQLKRYLTQKLFVFSGLQIEAETMVMPGNRILPPRIGAKAGVGYDVNDNFLLEVKSNFQLNKSLIGVFGERQIRMPAVYTVSSKYKF
ncbi:MAG: hypothetical protein AB8B59_06860 [Maribacter sp.]